MADFKDLLKKANESISKVNAQKAAINSQDRKMLLAMLAQDLLEALKPAIKAMQVTKEDLKDALSKVRIEAPIKPEVNVTVPDIIIPDIELPTINVPEPRVTVNVPDVIIPEIRMPDEMTINGWVKLQGVDLQNPLPVQLRDKDGKPVNLFENLTTLVNQSGGGNSSKIVKVNGLINSALADYINADNRVRVSVETGGGGLTDSELRASSVDVKQVSGSVDSVNVLQLAGDALAKGTEANVGFLRVLHAADAGISVNVIAGSTSGTQYNDAGNADPGTGALVMARDSAGSVYALRIGTGTSETALRVIQASDAIASVNIVSGSSSGTEYADGATAEPATGTVAMGDTGEESGNIFALRTASGATDSTVLRVVHATDVAVSVSATQVGTWNIATVTDVTNSVKVSTLPETIQTQLNAIQSAVEIMDDWDETDRAKVNLVTGQAGVAAGQGDTDVRTLRVVQAGDSISSVSVTNTVTVTGSLTSVVAVGPTAADAADDGNPPIQLGGVARTANPTAVSGGDVVKTSHDDLGRALIRPVQVRDLTQTAYVELTNGTETTLLAASAGVFHDLIYVVGANSSGAAVRVDLRAVTAGNIMLSLEIPANGTAGIACPVPLPQDATGNNWTADLPDITGTTVRLTALFSKEV